MHRRHFSNVWPWTRTCPPPHFENKKTFRFEIRHPTHASGDGSLTAYNIRDGNRGIHATWLRHSVVLKLMNDTCVCTCVDHCVLLTTWHMCVYQIAIHIAKDVLRGSYSGNNPDCSWWTDTFISKGTVNKGERESAKQLDKTQESVFGRYIYLSLGKIFFCWNIAGAGHWHWIGMHYRKRYWVESVWLVVDRRWRYERWRLSALDNRLV